VSPVGEWESEAENWTRWARTARHDAYWDYRDSFFDHVVPPPGRRSLEIGCGEGRVARDLVARGHPVVGVDSSPTLVSYARRADPESSYLVADGACLPLRDGCFDLVVAYNSLQTVPDMVGTVREAARVLSPAGRFCLCVSHPITDVGRFDGEEADAPFVVRDDYFARRRVDDKAERDGLEMRFRGWTYSIEDYVCALEEAGLLIEGLREPRPKQAYPRRRRWSRIPMFLMIKSIKAK
jgi:SAM-dependent methyltransferase